MDLPALFKTVTQYFPDFWLGTVASAAFGAFAGAWINNRIQAKKAAKEELNSVRAALVLCFSIANRFMSLKKQHVRGMRNRYVQARQEYDEFEGLTRPPAGKPVVFDLRVDFQTIMPIVAPIQVLERYVFEKISIRGRALAAAVDLVGAIHGLNAAISYRNDLILEIQKQSPMPFDLLAQRYFGLVNADGITDERYQQGIMGIYAQTDDCIFFARILAEDLLTYGSRLRRSHQWKLRRLGVPKFKAADWSAAEREGLIPPNEEYKSWLAGFRVEPSWWQRSIARIRVN